jgi:hypothetical protein
MAGSCMSVDAHAAMDAAIGAILSIDNFSYQRSVA